MRATVGESEWKRETGGNRTGVCGNDDTVVGLGVTVITQVPSASAYPDLGSLDLAHGT